ncbi:hypothetical protein BKA65DRAFT_179681 [Rhexocercosporidium sp. MPI-PUGE-AT-0058]|nr:hypothetical protein BKA65DRAFT_179681 [Rhexocercosporidium sp. MPI-PUGE-AT-0058]
MLGLSLIVLAALSRFPLANAHPSFPVERANANACGEIRNRVKAAFQADPGARPLVPAQLGYDCLMSVPLHKAEALTFVDSLVPYLGWQSSLTDMKSPPPGYPYPGVDIIQEVSKIRQKLQTDQYTNEYSYMLDISKVIVSGHDALFDVTPDILYAALTFARPKNLALVSLSQDGCQLPKIYLRDEIKTNPKSSAVTMINGVPAVNYIDKLVGASSGYPDRDAGYNSYFYSVAYEASLDVLGEFQGFGPNSLIYSGPNTTLTFENGTTRTYDNQARVRESFEGVTDGKSFYQRFCTGAQLNYTGSTLAPQTPRRYAYPKQMTDPVESSIAGYYMDAPGYTNIAVLSVLDWSPDSVTAFQSIAEDFLRRAKADNKKVVVDLTSCANGYYFLAYDLFKQFFPHLSVLDYNRVRETDAFNVMTTIGSGPKFDHYDAKTATPLEVSLAESVFNYRKFEIDINNKNFPTYQSKYGPIMHNGDSFTDIMRFNLSNPRISSSTDGFGLQITGLGSRSNFTQPFDPADVVLLVDGMCASPCPIFATNMASQMKVRTVAIGGRPALTPMQSVGGTTGPEGWGFGTILYFAQSFTQFASKEQKAILSKFNDACFNRLMSSFLSFRDVIKPAQLGSGPGKLIGSNFVREDADCRIFYTRSMVTDPREMWKKAADVTWHGKKCVVGR